MEAILRVYNQLGRRDNLYKARIKILVHELGAERFAEMVEEEWAYLKDGPVDLPPGELERIEAYFARPPYRSLAAVDPAHEAKRLADPAFARWVKTNVAAHKVPGYAIANISLKPEGEAPGDASAEQLDAVADLAERYSLSEIRVTHEQNLVLAHVETADLHGLWQGLVAAGLATPNIGLVSDIIACPGLDYCNLANARSIPVAQAITRRFTDLERQHDVGDLKIKISGCINACGHHHVGEIGILGVDKKGEEYYQITLGGSPDDAAAIGSIVGRAFAYDEVVDAVETIVDTYVAVRAIGEGFNDTYARVGAGPFKEKLYGTH
jgi:sulfite reductase (NADPH) hemoprotein beta-component